MGCAFVDLGLRVYRARGFRVQSVSSLELLGSWSVDLEASGVGGWLTRTWFRGLGKAYRGQLKNRQLRNPKASRHQVLVAPPGLRSSAPHHAWPIPASPTLNPKI